MQPTALMRATEPIYHIGAAYYFEAATVERGKQAGLDGFRFYFLGRGGVLGDVEADVVRAAFGYFEPSLLAKMWNTAKERVEVSPRDVARLYMDCAHEYGRTKLTGIDGLTEFAAAAGKVIAAVEGASMPLFAAFRAEPVPEDPPAAAIHQAVVLREMRGSAHLLAIAAVGLSSAVAHAIKRPNDVQLFGYTAELAPTVTDADRGAWERAEALTDTLLAPAYEALTAAEADALVTGTAAMAAAIAT